MGTTRIRRAGRGLLAGRIVGRFDDIVITGYRSCYFFTAGRSPRQEDRNGCFIVQFDDGVIDIAYPGVELAGKSLHSCLVVGVLESVDGRDG